MQVDYLAFITKGEFGNFKYGTPWKEVIKVLGVPPLYEPPGEETNALARYGELQLTIRDEMVVAISLYVYHFKIELPENISITNFEEPQLEIAAVQDILKMSGITWERGELMCDDWIDYYRTSTGVHLSFGGKLLGVVGACNPDNFWGLS